MIADHTNPGRRLAALLVAGLALYIAGAAASVACAQDEKHEGEKREATGKDRDIDKLFELVRQARADLEALRVRVGIRRDEGESRGEHAEGRRERRGEHGEARRDGRGEHGEGRREARGEHGERRGEGRGEHGEGRAESGPEEEGGKRLGKHETWNGIRNGARLILAYDAATQSFKGIVQNTTSKPLSEVRVEVHLSNGVELGPTKRTDLGPGEMIPVELSAADQEFTWWTTHPEHGSEEGHGPGHEGEREGLERGKGDEGRPNDPALRPLYNELLLLRHEIQMLARDLRNSKE